MLGYPQESVLLNFERATALDPKNDRIRHNLTMAASLTAESSKDWEAQRRFIQAPSVEPNRLREEYSEQIKNRVELLAAEHLDQRFAPVSANLDLALHTAAS